MRRFTLYIVTNGAAFAFKQNFDDKQEAIVNADYLATMFHKDQHVEVWENAKGSKEPCYVVNGVL